MRLNVRLHRIDAELRQPIARFSQQRAHRILRFHRCQVAGNIADDVALGSMEYAVDHFATALIVVLGHERCGAVSATVEAVKTGTMPRPHIASLVSAIAPAVEAVRHQPGDPVENAIRQNVRSVVALLKSSAPVLDRAASFGWLDIVGAEYHLASGRVNFLG